MKKTVERDGRIEILRFLFCLLIMMHHSTLVGYGETRPFASAYVFVEFFFFISGYYLCRRYMGNENKDMGVVDRSGLLPVKYAFSKWKSLVFYSMANVLMINVFYWIVESWSIRTALNALVQEIPEALLLPLSGLEPRFLILPLWYVSAYLLVLPLFIFLIRNHRKLFLGVGILFALLYYGYTFIRWGSVVEWHSYLGFCYNGLIRALAGLTVGGFIYFASTELQRITLTKFGRLLLTVIECSALVTAVCVSCFIARDYFIIGLVIILLTSMLSEQSYTSHIKAPG